jgi:hypothetical protein
LCRRKPFDRGIALALEQLEGLSRQPGGP